jgi:hypothetical protein
MRKDIRIPKLYKKKKKTLERKDRQKWSSNF